MLRIQPDARLVSTAALVLLALAPPAAAQWSTTAPLSEPRWRVAAAATNGWTLFAGGLTCSFNGGAACATDRVDAFEPATGTWRTASLSSPRMYLAAATAADGKVLFAGGLPAPSSGVGSATVDVYDPALGAPDNPAAWSQASLSQGRGWFSAAVLGPYVLFAGGTTGTSRSDVVDVYDSSTGTWSIAHLSVARNSPAAVSVGGRVLFAGGLHDFGQSDVVDVYDSTLGPPSDPSAWSTAQLSAPRNLIAGTSVGSLALFAGGAAPGPSVSDVVDVYDSATGTWSTAQLSVGRRWISAVTVGSLAVFAGGDEASSGDAFPVVAASDVVDVYDAVTGSWSAWTLPEARTLGAAVVQDGVAYLAGGCDGGNVSNRVDVLDPEIGQSYCVAAAPNSTGVPAALTIVGTNAASANSVRLTVTELPPLSFGFCLTSTTAGLVTQPGGSQGNLCLGGAIGRFVGPGEVQNSGAQGTFSLALDLGALPSPTGFVAASAGETWNFQAWYRDANPGVTSNFSSASALTLR